ncbi:hypothetical protein D0T11_17755 [Hymenobacter rubripertinctus]|uniref:Uncharacterized protein n=2 Tax=Hymenobacter rubripertinctus TaxID=2029981 RepID=A0A418QNX5_9BACT|nr:hypothetical protein D0T11_17755 [Hymenobacter rubripertinctus]
MTLRYHRLTFYVSLPAYPYPTAMPAIEPPKLVIEFRGDQAKFQTKAYRARIERVLRVADELTDRAVVDRDRLKVRAQL